MWDFKIRPSTQVACFMIGVTPTPSLGVNFLSQNCFLRLDVRLTLLFPSIHGE